MIDQDNRNSIEREEIINSQGSWKVKEEWTRNESGQSEEEEWREYGDKRERDEEKKEARKLIKEFDIEAQPVPNYLKEPLFLVEAEIEKKKTHDIKALREDDPYVISIILENRNYMEDPHHVTM